MILWATGVLLCILLFVCLNQLYKRTNAYQNAVGQVEKFRSPVPPDLQVVNTGSSYGLYSIGYPDEKGFNFALQPQSLSYDFRLLQAYSAHLAPQCKVLICISNFAMCFTDYPDAANTKYYYFLGKEKIPGYSRLRKITHVVFPLLASPRAVKYIFSDSPRTDGSICNTRQETRKAAASRVRGWKVQFSLENMEDPAQWDTYADVFQQTTGILQSMIKYCLDNGWEPYIVIPPVSMEMNALVPKRFLQPCLYDNIQRANQSQIPVLDYLTDDRFQDCSLYFNADFMNAEGRKKFSQVILRDIGYKE